MRNLLLHGTVCLVLLLAILIGRSPQAPDGLLLSAPAPLGRPGPIAMFGETPGRNLVNSLAFGLPTDWSVAKGKEKNVLWVADLGSKGAMWGPAIHQGKV